MSGPEATLATPAAARHNPNVVSLSLSRTVVELKQFFRNPQSAIFTFALPVGMLIIFSAIFSYKIDGPAGESLSFRQYFVAGMVASGIMSSTFNSLAISIATEQHEGLLKRLAGTPLPRSAYFAGKIGMGTVVAAIQTAIMLVIGLFFGLKLPVDPTRWAVFIGVLVLGVATCSLLGIAYTRLIPNASSAPAIVTPAFIILQFISGVFFTFDMIPTWMQGIASLFPLRWMALGLRYAFLPDWFKTQETGGSWNLPWVWGVLLIWLVIGFAASLRFFRWDRSKGA
ncbi:MAG: ABC transporter permease [Tepidiformaceae bacterium]